jgi:hypothetical protein
MLVIFIKNVLGRAKRQNIKLKRTKCIQIITDVLQPYCSDDLRIHIGNSAYGLIIAKSSDTSTTKLLLIEEK